MALIEKSELTQIASRFVNNTNQHIFLTGKAGTGKTTFLRSIIETTHKNVVVAAPTGIAAINAGGVTLHSLFQLPFGAFIPENRPFDNGITFQACTPKSLMEHIQMNKYKRRTLQEMELLIIDEVSMLRADLLDAIDTVLRSVRRRHDQFFGGVQILFIGDMLQLPPIVKDNEWHYLSRFYKGMYFFNALALQQNPPVYIELDKIYRQNDPDFIQILNNLRDNNIGNTDIEILNRHFKPDFEPGKNDGYIFLNTHNYQADKINADELQKLAGKSFTYDAEVSGDFSEYSYPVEFTLELKEGAQIMFIKNDYSGEQLYFNGKIGYISDLSKDNIKVEFNDGSDPCWVEPYTWENVRYTLNQETNEIEEKIVGTFKHFPIKLAWAITIHKSQGLTFEKAIIDVSRAFAPGQAYVALSRLTSLKGLVLTGRIPSEGLSQDSLIHNFTSQKTDKNQLHQSMVQHSFNYIKDIALKAFDFRELLNQLQYHLKSYNKDENRSTKQKHIELAQQLVKIAYDEKQIADKFSIQINKILNSNKENTLSLSKERIEAAKGYFSPKFNNCSQLIKDKIALLESTKGTKKYITELKEVEALFFKQLTYMLKTDALINTILRNSELSKSDIKESDLYKERVTKKGKTTKTQNKEAKPKKEKKEKVDTKAETLKLYLEGLKIKDIAKERGFKEVTIEGHLAHYVENGTLEISEFASQEKVDWIFEIIDELETTRLSPIKEIVLDDLSYGEIKMIMAHYKREKPEKVAQFIENEE